MDLYCAKCGEPWEHDTVHDVASEKYGIKYGSPGYDGIAYGKVFRDTMRDFQARGCQVLGSSCSKPSTETDKSFGLTRQEAAGALYDILGDDTDGAAAMLEDMGW